MTAPNSNFSQISAVTRRYFLPKLADNIFKANPLLERAKRQGWYKKIEGGTKVIIPLEYAINGNSNWFSGADTLTISDTDIITAAEYDWKQLYAPVVVTRIDELKNMGEARVVDFVKAKVKNAEKTMAQKLSEGLYSAGSSATEIVGLRAHLSTSSTVGGISQSSNTWWAAQIDSTTTTLTLAAMQTVFNNCSEGNDQPTVAVATKARYNSYYAALQPQQRFTDSLTGKAGFTSLMFNGIPLISDSNASSSLPLMFLNEDYLHFLAHKDEDMVMTDFEDPINQRVAVAKIFWAGAFGSSNNRFQGGFTALTA
jgi:hypothetical protein